MKLNRNKFEIAVIIGTRAELIKTFPLMLELQKRNVGYYFIHTGQHSLGDLCEKLGVKKPDIILSKEPEKSSKFNAKNLKGIFWNIFIIPKIRKVLKNLESLRYVVYHGDTMTTASASIASSRLLNPFKKYKNVHLEAGLRSWNIFEPFPEEISRRIVGRFSDVLLAVSEQAEKNLVKHKRKKIIFTGNTIIDSADIAYSLAKKRKIKPLSKGKFVVISIHRHENIKSKERMRKIVEILLSVPIKSFFAMHDNTKAKLEEFGLMEKLRQNQNIKIINTLDYVSFVYQTAKCSLIICDGGSMQEESLIFKKPCIILRKATERPEGLETGFQFLSNFDVEKTKEKIKEYLNPKFKIKAFENPYGNKGVSKKIFGVLR